MIYQVPPGLVVELWPAIEGYAARVCRYHPFMEAQDMLAHVLHGYGTLFVATQDRQISGFAIMEMVEYPGRKVANCLACGGRFGFLSVAVHDLLPMLKDWGCRQGADTFAITGRPGWIKALRHEDGDYTQLVTWWQRLGDVQGRRQTNYQSAANLTDNAVGHSRPVH